MTSFGYALARAELIRALTAYTGIATDDGAADGTTIVDANLDGKNDFITEKTIIIMSGPAAYEDKGAQSFVSAHPATITLQGTGFSAQIKAGTIFRILNISSIEIDVATINTKIGTDADAAGTTTLFAWLLKLFEQGGQGLVYYGEVTTYTDVTHFRVSGLTGFGDDYFANNYRVYVVWDKDGAGAAPQGEMQPCSDYDSTDGIFTHTAFTVPLEVGDKVLLIHERLAEVADIKVQTDKIAGKMLFSMDFWSDPQEEVPVGDAVAGATEALPTVTIADLPTNATIVRAIAMFKFRMIENINAAANKLNGATVATTSQVIQVDDSGATGYVDAIKFVDDQFGIAAETREGGDVLIGSIDIATRVDGNDTYSIQWLLARADLDFLNFHDVQCGLRIWYSI